MGRTYSICDKLMYPNLLLLAHHLIWLNHLIWSQPDLTWSPAFAWFHLITCFCLISPDLTWYHQTTYSSFIWPDLTKSLQLISTWFHLIICFYLISPDHLLLSDFTWFHLAKYTQNQTCNFQPIKHNEIPVYARKMFLSGRLPCQFPAQSRSLSHFEQKLNQNNYNVKQSANLSEMYQVLSI